MRKFVITLALIISLVVLPPLPHSVAQPSSYSEELRAYIAGQNGVWFLTFKGVNSTDQILSSIESEIGLNSYTISAIKLSNAFPDFQIFGKDGYGVIDLPFLPDQGLFLTIDSVNRSIADGLITRFNKYLKSAFVPISDSGNKFLYFSPIDFDNVAAPTFFKFFPSAEKGFASIFNRAQFVNFLTPMMFVKGERISNGFMHALTLGSAEPTALDSSSNLLLSSLLRLQNSTIRTSPSSSNSSIFIHSLDGIIVSNDPAKTTNDMASFTGDYSISIPADRRVQPNVTIVQDIPVAVGTRILDRGALNQGDFLSITLQIQNIGGRGSIQNLFVNDSWWMQYSNLFQLTAGNSSFKIPLISAGENVSRTYVLRVISSDKSDIIIPSTASSYQFLEGSQVFTEKVVFNEAEIRTNDIGTAISISAKADVHSGAPLGVNGNFLITVKNLGNAPALNLKVLNFTIPTLAQGGQSWRLNISIPTTSLTERNVTQTFQVQWQTPDGEIKQLSSNQAIALFSHTNMNIPFTKVSIKDNFSPSSSEPSVRVMYDLRNTGKVNSSQVTAMQTLPEGVTCTSVIKGSASCSGNGIIIQYDRISTKLSQIAEVKLTFSKTENFVVMPMKIITKYKELSLQTYSSPIALPAGLTIKKAFDSSSLFEGMVADVVVTTSNSGSSSIYNATISSPADSFDTIKSGSLAARKVFPEIKSKESFSFNYSVIIQQTSGTKTLAPINANFIFAGINMNLEISQGTVGIFKPLKASIISDPQNPIEGTKFRTMITITNPASVNVSNVYFALPVPNGLEVIDSRSTKSILIELPHLIANSSYSADFTLKANTDVQLDPSKAKFTFQFMSTAINGTITKQVIVVGEDFLSRYFFPMASALLATILALILIHRKISIAPSSQRETPQKRP